ncbi:MAG: S53 family peptidase [Bacteroidetes bacterium]|jgi:kumamolisin|nr:S53 family peptidase [Bacteroidota bacterium]
MENSTHVLLPGSNRMVMPGSKVISKANPNEIIELTIKLRQKQSVPEPGAKPGIYLSRQEFADKYGASADDMEKTKKVLAGYGLETMSENSASHSIRVSGSIEDVENAFQVKLFHYQNAERGDYRGRTGSIHIPKELDKIIEGVFGLDNRPVVKKRRHHNTENLSLTLASTPKKHRSWFYPAELAEIYDCPEGDGSGQTIGILEFGGGYFPDDLALFCKTAQVGVPTVIPISVEDAPTNTMDDAAGEVMLDIEVVAGVCPKSTIVVYFSKFSEQGWVDCIDAAIHDTKNNPNVISISWGYAEDAPGVWSLTAINAVNTSLKAAASLGITVCVASGDDGSDDGVGDGHAHVDFPASSPYVLGVGGTAVAVKNGKVTETVWKQGSGVRQPQDGSGAGGGGISVYFARPSWQKVNIPSVNPGAIVGRCVPDVAADASGATGYLMVLNGKTFPNGGTSAAAPLWAGIIARVNASLDNGKRVGYLTPMLYQQFQEAGALGTSVCTDITVGNNISSVGGGYTAGQGYDAVTGWGSPKGKALLNALKTIFTQNNTLVNA